MQRLRITFNPFKGWSKKYRVQIKLRGSMGIGNFWYDVSDVTPYKPTGFRTAAEAIEHAKYVASEFGFPFDVDKL